MLTSQMVRVIAIGLRDTLYMTVVSTAMAYIIGLPLGILLVVTKRKGIMPCIGLNKGLNTIVNILRSVPFLILLIAVMPITRYIVGTSIGAAATIVPLVIAAFPFVGRLVESSVDEVEKGMVEAAQSMGATTLQIIFRVLIKEAFPSLIKGASIAITTILGYSAMAGIVGGGGLGDIAIRYGYYRYQNDVMIVTVIILIVLVQIFQGLGNISSQRTNKK